MNKLKRAKLLSHVRKALSRSRVVALLGPRQCGKTTLARDLCRVLPESHWFDLENPRDLARLESPQIRLEGLKGLVVLDEIQLRPDLMPLLRVLSDRSPNPAKFLILGSASPSLARQSSETLAGRVEFVAISGFSLEETGFNKLNTLWVRGGFPRSFLARSGKESMIWRENFIQTFLERDLRQLGIQIPAVQLRRFWQMAAHLHGRHWNGSEIAASLAVSQPTSRRYLDILTGAFMIRQLVPWHVNTGKRQVKSPKVYVRDSGILHALLRLEQQEEMESHPLYGHFWEGFCLEQILQRTGDQDVYFWGTHAGAELDLLILRKGKKWGFEFKVNDAPTLTKSMRSALADLNLEHLWIVYPGSQNYSLHTRVDCIGLKEALQLNILKL